MSRLTIGIVGAGVVGGALIDYIENKTEHRLLVYDPSKKHFDALNHSDIVFISVPVPCKGFKQDLSILESAIENVPHGIPIIIRSTITPGTCEMLTEKYGRSFSHIPEFLTARRAYEDMVSQKYVYLGLGSTVIQSELISMIQNIFADKDVLPVGAKEAEMLKYCHNLHGAVKVTYWNIIYDLCKKQDIDFNIVRLAATSATGFINDEHTYVPGPDKKLGFGGTCFPVNLENFIGYTRGLNGLAAKFFEDTYCLNRLFRGLK